MSLEQGPSQTLTRVMPSYRRHLLQTESQVLPIPLLLEKLAAALYLDLVIVNLSLLLKYKHLCES